jgi:tRNA A-37 threonylcarbamoyl transferase component Bud32
MIEPPQRMVGGRYRLTGVSGRGAAGVVWHGTDELIGRPVAVKELRAPAGMNAEDRAVLTQRALREARTAGRVDHPGVIAVHDVVPATTDDDAIYIVMELVEAPSLADLLQRDEVLPEATVATMGWQLLDALAAAHELGVVHRDVKPANIMVLPDDQVKLVDFGIAHATEDTRLTREGVMGSTGYLAPELFHGEDPTPASDLWSLGATLFHAVAGTGPFEHASTAATLHAVLYDDLPAPPCGPPLATVVTGLLTRDPGQRMTASQAAALLRPAAGPVPPDGGSVAAAIPAWEVDPTTAQPVVARSRPKRKETAAVPGSYAAPLPPSAHPWDGWLALAGVLWLLGLFGMVALGVDRSPLFGVAAAAPARKNAAFSHTEVPFVFAGLAILLAVVGFALFVKRIQAGLAGFLAGTAPLWVGFCYKQLSAFSNGGQMEVNRFTFVVYLAYFPVALASVIAAVRLLRKPFRRKGNVATLIAGAAALTWFLVEIWFKTTVAEVLLMAPVIIGVPVLATLTGATGTRVKVLIGWALGLALKLFADLITIAHFSEIYVKPDRTPATDVPASFAVFASLTATAIVAMLAAAVVLSRTGREPAGSVSPEALVGS